VEHLEGGSDPFCAFVCIVIGGILNKEVLPIKSEEVRRRKDLMEDESAYHSCLELLHKEKEDA
jgi:hypothetical protein